MAGLTAVFKALSNPNRLEVYRIIVRAAGRVKKGLTVEQICREAGMKQPAVSHHVARLHAAGLIERTKSRWWVHCTPSREGLDLLLRFSRSPGDMIK